MSSLFIRVVGVVLLVNMWLFPAGAMAAPELSGETIHIVQWGETLSLIAERYGVTVDAILTANNLHDPDFVYVGQRLVIPAHDGRYGSGRQPPVPDHGGGQCANYYEVELGDTLSGIAWRYDTTANELMQANGLYSDLIYEGQRLCVPPDDAGRPWSEPSNQVTYYTVRAGDTIAAIASRFGVSQTDIVQANNLASASLIYVDQRLLIPGVYAKDHGGSNAVTGGPPPPSGEQRPYSQPGPVGGQSPYGAPSAPEYAPTGPQSPHQGDQSPGGVPPAPDYSPTAAHSSQMGEQPPHGAPTGSYPARPSGDPVVIRSEPQWTGSQTAHSADPDEITTLVVMTHDKEGVDVMIRSKDGFVARGYTGVYYEYSWIPTFAFRNIPGGLYEVWVEGEPSRWVNAKLDPGWRALVEFKWKIVSTEVRASPSGWIGEVVENTSGTDPIGAFSILVVRTGAIGHKIRVTAPGGFETICITGTKPEHGSGACDIGGLNAGTYQVILDGADVAVELYLDGVGTATVEFRPARHLKPASLREH